MTHFRALLKNFLQPLALKNYLEQPSSRTLFKSLFQELSVRFLFKNSLRYLFKNSLYIISLRTLSLSLSNNSLEELSFENSLNTHSFRTLCKNSPQELFLRSLLATGKRYGSRPWQQTRDTKRQTLFFILKRHRIQKSCVPHTNERNDYPVGGVGALFSPNPRNTHPDL